MAILLEQFKWNENSQMEKVNGILLLLLLSYTYSIELKSMNVDFIEVKFQKWPKEKIFLKSCDKLQIISTIWIRLIQQFWINSIPFFSYQLSRIISSKRRGIHNDELQKRSLNKYGLYFGHSRSHFDSSMANCRGWRV